MNPDDYAPSPSPPTPTPKERGPNFLYCNLTNYTFSPFCNDTFVDEIYGRTDYTDAFTLERIVSTVVPVLFGIIVVVGLFGNALVVIVVAANKQMRNTTNLLIINLAMADLLFIIFCVPFTATDYALPFWPFGDIWCKIVQYLVIVTAYASVYTLVLMSLDRFLAVVHPITSMSIRTERNTILAIALTWVFILITCVPVMLAHGEVTYPYAFSQHSVCVFLDKKGYNHPAFQISFFATSYVIPLALICGLYLCMLMKLWYGVAPGGRVSAESRRGKRRVTRMVVIVVVIFAVCWCPIQLVLVLKSLDLFEITPVNVLIQITAHVLGYMNSCVNPILYAFLSDNFRKAFRKVIYCAPRRRPAQNGRLEEEKTDTRALTIKSTRTNDNNDIL